MSHSSNSTEGSVRVIIFALLSNFGIACAKFAGAFFTRSASMLAEAIHSLADCTNQIFLLIGARKSKKPADNKHPLGYGRENFFWSFLVALLLFFMGGVFAIYEGVHKLNSTSENELISPWISMVILIFSIALEGGSFFACLKEIKKQNRYKNLWVWFKNTTASDLIVIFMEDLAALLGLVIALVFLTLAWVLNNSIWDAIGSIVIGALLISVATLLGNEVKSLIIGESASEDYRDFLEKLFQIENKDMKILKLISLATGSNEVLISAKVHPGTVTSAQDLIEKINRVEVQFKKEFPEIRWSFIEPDTKE